MDKLLIIGIDPGTTKSYAILDVNGNILDVKSSKKFNINDIVNNIIKFGNPILIGTDVSKIPKFVDEISSRFNSRTFKPEINLQRKHKIKLVKKFLKKKNFEIKNKHENDALIAAILAYKSIKNLLKKIEDKYLDKKYLIDDIKNLVLRDKINIKEAENSLDD